MTKEIQKSLDEQKTLINELDKLAKAFAEAHKKFFASREKVRRLVYKTYGRRGGDTFAIRSLSDHEWAQQFNQLFGSLDLKINSHTWINHRRQKINLPFLFNETNRKAIENLKD